MLFRIEKGLTVVLYRIEIGLTVVLFRIEIGLTVELFRIFTTAMYTVCNGHKLS